MKSQSKKYINQNPGLKKGYDKIFKGILLFGNIPWVIIAIGELTGITNGLQDYFNPKSLNPLVLIFHFYILLIWVLSVHWIFFKDGADFLAQHPGLISYRRFNNSNDITSSKDIKILFALALFGTIGILAMMWLLDFPTMIK